MINWLLESLQVNIISHTFPLEENLLCCARRRGLSFKLIKIKILTPMRAFLLLLAVHLKQISFFPSFIVEGFHRLLLWSGKNRVFYQTNQDSDTALIILKALPLSLVMIKASSFMSSHQGEVSYHTKEFFCYANMISLASKLVSPYSLRWPRQNCYQIINRAKEPLRLCFHGHMFSYLHRKVVFFYWVL